MFRSSRLNSLSGERLGLLLFAAFIGTLVWSLNSSAARPNINRDSATSSYSMTLAAPIESPTPCCNDKPHLLVGTYYSVKNGFTAKLLLNNKGPDPLTASPTLFSMSGQRFDAPPVTISGQSFQMIDMSAWINVAGPQFEEGSIQVFHVGKDLVLGAQVYLVDEAHSLSFDEKLVETNTFKSSGLEGLWWLPSQNGQVLLVLSNNSDAAVNATVNANGQTPSRSGVENVLLAAHETRTLDIQSDVIQHANGAMSRFGGISVNYSGSPGTLYARAMAQDLSIGYSLAIQFSDPAAGKSSQLQGVGLRLGFAGGEALIPMAVVRNVSSSNTTVTGRVSYTDRAGTTNVFPMEALHLSPSELVTVDLGQLLRQHGHHQPDAVGGLELEYSTPKGSVIASTLSVSTSGNQVFRVPMWDIYALRSSTGGYPWSIDGNSSTFVYIKNAADHEQQYLLHVKYDGGEYAIGNKTVGAGQTVTYDLRKLRDDQIPDNRGRVIPLNVNSGQVHWSKVGAETGVLIGRSEQADVTVGISSNYACINCCSDNPNQYDFHVVPGSTSALVNDSVYYTARIQMSDCYGGSYYTDVTDAEWTSDNPEVADIGAGVALAQAPGSADINARWQTQRYFSVGDGGGGEFLGGGGGGGSCESFNVTYDATPATLTVKPILSGVNTIWWFNDYPSPNTSHFPIVSTLTASASNTGSYTYRIVSGSDKAGLGPDLASTYVSSSNQVDVTSRKGSTTLGDVVVTVTANGVTSASFHMTIRRPSRLALDNGYPTTRAIIGADQSQTALLLFNPRLLITSAHLNQLWACLPQTRNHRQHHCLAHASHISVSSFGWVKPIQEPESSYRIKHSTIIWIMEPTRMSSHRYPREISHEVQN